MRSGSSTMRNDEVGLGKGRTAIQYCGKKGIS